MVQAETQLLSTRAQAIDLRATRAQLEHAIAVLVGKAPAAFSIPPAKLAARIPEVPPAPPVHAPRAPSRHRRGRAAHGGGQRRDRRGRRRRTSRRSRSRAAAASRRARSPRSSPRRSLVWSLGAGLAGTVLDFGARGAAVASSRAAYDEAVANYRETVLTAFQDVEDNLASAHWLAEESKVQQEAVRAARESVALTSNQYKAGTVGSLNVAVVQAAQLNEERATVKLLGRRLAATVALIRALGGSW